ncbi:GNAT family N-acetyltransferase [Tundrisphaera lichenicola]|uniref:GNAT family N-acetyltransferase n=1 Tax=Tundrisphaera lichenicola TaxID=2029860 RepID=UPI003EBDE259
MTAPFSIEILGSSHDRAVFISGVEPLDRYFREQASQDIKRRATACYVAVELATGKVAGYYTLAASGIPLGELPESLIKKLPRYPLVPVARLGRLAVDLAYRGQKLGAALVWDAVARCLRSEVAVAALVVDAKDEQAEAFYRHLGFLELSGEGKRLVLPLAKLR